MVDPMVVCSGCGAKNRVPVNKRHLPARCGRCGNSLENGVLTGVVHDLADNGFADFLAKNHLPVLVDFYSPACGPCRMTAPMVVNIAEKYVGRLVVAKIDTSKHGATAGRLNIRAVPTLVFYQAGREVDRQVGVSSQVEIERKLGALL